MTQTVSTGPQVNQRTPSRFFGLTAIKTFDQFYQYRDSAYALVVQSIMDRKKSPAAFDTRPVTPIDDFTGKLPGVTNNYFGDWSIAAATITDTGGSLAGTGNTILTGTMPNDYWLCVWGTELLTATPAPEVMWSFKSGQNSKAIWFLHDLFGWEAANERPKAVSTTMPVWGPSAPVSHIVYCTGSRIVYDVHLTIWAEPSGQTVTSVALQA